MPAKGFELKHFFIPGPFIGYQHLRDLLIRVLSWSLFSERGAGELSAGNTRICSRANKNSRKGGKIQGGVEAEANLEGPLYPELPCMLSFFLMTSSWMGSWMALPVRYFLHDLVMGEISHYGSWHSIFFKDIKIKLKGDRVTGWNASGDLYSYTRGACGYIISFQFQVYLDKGTDSHNAVVTEKKLWKRLLLIKICQQVSSCVTEFLWSSRPHSC